jgi:hypothetical protein
MRSLPVPGPTAGDRVRYRIGPFWYRYPTAGAWVPKRLAALAQTPEYNSRPQLASRAFCSESPGTNHDFPIGPLRSTGTRTRLVRSRYGTIYRLRK